MASLVNREGVRFGLRPGRITIGRGPENDIVLRHRSVSRQHAEIRAEQGKVFIKDLASSNGTWIGDRRIRNVRLADGDVVRFGELEFFKFEERGSARSASEEHKGSVKARTLRGPVGIRRRTHLVPHLIVAGVLLGIMGFGVGEFVAHRGSIFEPARQNAGSSEKAPSLVNSPAANVPNRASDTTGPSDIDAGAGSEIATDDVVDAILETDREHAGDSSWVHLDTLADMCNRGSLPKDSLRCRVAYLVQHSEGKDPDQSARPATVSYADLSSLCSHGVIDTDSDVCLRAYAGLRLDAMQGNHH